jgi:hypothetical protein
LFSLVLDTQALGCIIWSQAFVAWEEELFSILGFVLLSHIKVGSMNNCHGGSCVYVGGGSLRSLMLWVMPLVSFSLVVKVLKTPLIPIKVNVVMDRLLCLILYATQST